jgi:hypothetical protein
MGTMLPVLLTDGPAPLNAASHHRDYAGPMRISEFWERMDAAFGSLYAQSLAVDYRVPALGSSISEAIERGVAPKTVWRAVWAEFELPASQR